MTAIEYPDWARCKTCAWASEKAHYCRKWKGKTWPSRDLMCWELPFEYQDQWDQWELENEFRKALGTKVFKTPAPLPIA